MQINKKILSQPSHDCLPGSTLKGDRQLMLFDLSIRGHHPNYIQHLIRYWSEQELSGYLDIVVSPRFLQEHADIVELAKDRDKDTIQFIAIAPEEEAALRSRKSKLNRIWRNFQEWQLLRQYTSKLKATHCIILYFDTYFLPLALGATPPCSFSGIYFRPTFHYPRFSGYVPSRWDFWQQWQEKLLLSRILSNPRLKTLFCLDPFAVKHLEQFNGSVKAVHLPDPVEQYPDLKLERIKEKLGIDRDRQVFLLFGALNERKGIYQLLEAILQLSPQLCQKLCLLMVGESSVAPQLETEIAAVCQAKPVQIIRRYEFIAEQEVQAHFQLADVILAPYQRHVGMSGILLLAAAAGKPVLSSDYGLMGEIVRRFELGLTVDSTRPSEIIKGITQFLLTSPADLCDHTKMRTFAAQNSAEEFARVIFDNV